MVEVVLPGPVEAVVADCILGNAELTRVFGAEHLGHLVDQLFALRIFRGARVGADNIGHRIPPQAIDPVFVEKHADAVGNEGPDLLAAEVRTRSPRRRPALFVLVKINPVPVVAAAVAVELFQIKPVRPVVVVHHINVHGDPAAVRLPDEFAQGIGSSVRPFDAVKIGGIVAPAVVAVEFVHRHEEHAIHPEFLEVVQTAGGIAQGGHFTILGRGVVEGARVQLVDHQVARLAGRRHGVFPVEGGRIMNHRLAGLG